ncbi:hypothetical protein PVV56_25115, partial [Salmonella enterica subsp. enterica serovar Typhimurium]|uniref:hypothetical protein n=1 Tax=Salmonella enterica TaxID=28901 RepID=UPI002FF59DA9
AQHEGGRGHDPYLGIYTPLLPGYGEAGRVAWHLTPLIARLWGSRSRSVAFNPLNRQAMEKQVA